jgi:tetratricopeptide (TPR) repeat protein
MHYFKSLIPAIFSVIIANAQLNACGTCGGCCNGKNSGKAIEAAMQQASWLSDWMTAKKFVKEKDFEKGIEHYSNAIKSLEEEESRVLSFGLLNERAAAYMAAGNIEKAIADYTYVIRESQGVTQDVLDAHFGRVDAYVKLGEIDRCEKDMDFLTKHDPNFPKISREGDFLVISNFNHDVMTKKETKAFKKFHLNLNVCESMEDILFLPGKKYIVKSPLGDKVALKKLSHVYAGLLKKYNPKIEFPSSMFKLPRK